MAISETSMRRCGVRLARPARAAQAVLLGLCVVAAAMAFPRELLGATVESLQEIEPATPDDVGSAGYLDAIRFGDRWLFTSSTGSSSGIDLSRTDGTAVGTEVIASFHGHPGWSLSARSIVTRHAVLFVAPDPELGRELWRTDGSTAGTYLLADTNPGSADGFESVFPSLTTFQSFDGYAWFQSDRDGFWYLWRSDGTPEGTVSLFPTVTRNFFEPAPLLVGLGNRLLFARNSPDTGAELWALDGADREPRMVADINPGPASAVEPFMPESLPIEGTAFLAVGDRLFLKVTDETGESLWVTDGTAGGTRRLTSTGETGRYFISPMQALGERVFFVAQRPETGREVWVTDGTSEGTSMLLDIRPGPEGSLPIHDDGEPEIRPVFRAAGDRMYFLADDGVHGFEMWSSDGTSAGTRMAADIAAGPGDMYVVSEMGPPRVSAEALGDELVFTADDGVYGTRLWITDGTSEGTRPLHDLLPGFRHPTEDDPFASGYPLLGTIAGEFYFASRWPGPGYSLWHTDGTVDGTRPVLEVTSAWYIDDLASTSSELLITAGRSGGAASLYLISGESAAGSGGSGGCTVVAAAARPAWPVTALVLLAGVVSLWRRRIDRHFAHGTNHNLAFRTISATASGVGRNVFEKKTRE